MISAVVIFINHNPLLVKQIDRFGDGCFTQCLFVTLDNLITSNHLWRLKHVSLQRNGLHVDLNVPILHCFLTKECLDHLLDPSNLLFRINTGLSKSVSHARSFTHAVRYAIEQAKFSWQVKLLFSYFDKEQRLLRLSDALVVGVQEVVGY